MHLTMSDVKCKICGVTRTDSNWRRGYGKQLGKLVGNTCKACYSASRKEYRKEYQPKWSKNNLEHRRHYSRKLLYGIDKHAFDLMLSKQNHACAICSFAFNDKEQRARPHVDHDHATGKVRGLLCVKCNLMLGYAQDSQQTLNKAIKYLNGEQ